MRECPLRAVCGDRSLTEEQIDRVVARLNKLMYRRDYWEENEELYE